MPSDLASLNSRPKANYRRDTNWPPGKPQRLTRPLAKRIFDAMSTSKDSLLGVLQANPDFPPHRQIFDWRRKVSWFAEGYREARKEQGEYLAQHCLDLAQAANPKNAHAIRIKYDIYKWFASKFAPDVYGDKPPTQTTNVAIGFNVSPERLNEIRGKLNITRDTLTASRNGNGSHNRLLQDQSVSPSTVSDTTNSDSKTPRCIPESPPLATESST